MVSKTRKFFDELGDRIKTSVRMKKESVFLVLALILIIVLGILVRMTPFFRTDALIKEFDPWIQYYTAQYLTQHSFFEYFNWYSYQFWWPSGVERYGLRPGLPLAAAITYKIFQFFGIPISLYDICYFWPAIWGGIAILIVFFLGKEFLDSRCGVLAAFFLAFSPGHIQRTVVGFFDNETIGVPLLLLNVLFYVKALKTGKIHNSILSGIFLGLLALSSGSLQFGFLFIPLLSLLMILGNRYSSRLLVSYIGTEGVALFIALFAPLFKANLIINDFSIMVPFFFMFFMLIYHVFDHQKIHNPKLYSTIWQIIKWGSIPAIFVFLIIYIYYPGILPFGLGERGGTILNPAARNAIALVASVGEHKPSPWSGFYFNALIPVILTPLGVYFAIKRGNDEDIVLITMTLTLLYFTGSMIRIILFLSPALALIGAYGLTHIGKFFGSLVKKEQIITRRRKRQVRKTLGTSEAVVIFMLIGVMLFTQINHATTVSVEQMSWSEMIAGGQFHDWEETLAYVNSNLDSTSVIMSWWDYGYWLSVPGNVTTVNDNGTMNHTRIGLTGMAFMQTDEILSAKVFKYLKADYALVFWGFLIGGLGGDEGKWPWMLRICNDHTAEYEAFGLREKNWGETTVFNEAEYINSSSGLYEDKWFETTLVKLMFYGEPTSLSSASTQLNAYYAAQIEGYESQNISPRQDDNGNLWSTHIPSNGEYVFNCFIPYYFSSNHLVKIFKLDYTALESSFMLSDPILYNNGFGSVDIINTGLRDISMTRIKINDIYYNFTIDYNNNTVEPGAHKTIWFNTNQFLQEWSVGDPYNITAEVSADALEGRKYIFENSTDNHAVISSPTYSIKIDRENSIITTSQWDQPVTVNLNVTNTGTGLVHVDYIKLFSSSVEFDDNKTTYLIKPGQTISFNGTSVGGFPGVVFDVNVNTTEGAFDSVSMPVNKEKYKLSIISQEREMISEERVKPYNYQDLTRKILFPNASSSILYDNGTLLLTVQNTGSLVMGLEGIMVNEELIDWSKWSTIGGDKILYPGESVKIKTNLGTLEKNRQYEVIVNATGQEGESVASDSCVLIPVTDGKAIKIIDDTLVTTSEVVSNETTFVTIKNVGLESVTVNTISLNGTDYDLTTFNAIPLYGSFVLNTYDVVKFAINVTGIKINQSDIVDVRVTASGVYDEQSFQASLPYGEGIVMVPSNTYGDVDLNKLHIDVRTAGFNNMTIDTIQVNGTYITPAQMTFELGENVISLLTSNYIEISGTEFGHPDIIAGETYVIIITMVEGPVKTYTIEIPT